MFASQIFTNLNVLLPRSAPAESSLRTYSTVSFTPPSCSLRCQEIAVEPLELHSKSSDGGETCWSERDAKSKDRDEESRKRKDNEEEVGDSKGISGIRVPRQRYIKVSKAQLHEALQSMFESEQDVNEFLRLASCLDSILHAEHKGVLEQLRMDYSISDSAESRTGGSEISDHLEEKMLVNGKRSVEDDASDLENLERNGKEEDKISIPFNCNLDLSFLLGSSAKNVKRNSTEESSIAVATRFQRAFMKLLRDAQFEELSARDLLLTSALNTDYLLTLPIYVDWKKASESNAIIFRRGYGTERQNGLLIVEKLDYLQSKLLQRIFFNLSKPLGKVGMWINEALESATQSQEVLPWTKRAKEWFKESLSQPSYFHAERKFDNQLEVDQLSKIDLPIWLAAQRAVSRYEGFLSPVGPRGRLLRKLLTWIGLVPSTPETSFELENDDSTSELYLRPTFLSRISLGDIWKPATREHCGNDVWKMLKNAVSILFSHSVLQEPAFQELILLYSEQSNQGENEDKAAVPLLKLKIYENIPIPDLPVIFPHKKLSFRILDTVRLDVASILGLLAFIVNYKFEDVLSSPSAIMLDVIAISALIIYVSRVALGYKQTWDRYQLLVNRTLYEKTLASGFGSVHFLLDASEQQKYKEAILAYAVLLQADQQQMSCSKSIGNTCERFIYDKFKEKVDMPAYEAMDTLRRLGLVTEVSVDGNLRPRALSCSEAYKALKQRWDSLLS